MTQDPRSAGAGGAQGAATMQAAVAAFVNRIRALALPSPAQMREADRYTIDEIGIPMVQAWGMTELSPLGSVAYVPADVEGDDAWSYRNSAGRIFPSIEGRLTGEHLVKHHAATPNVCPHVHGQAMRLFV